MPEALSQGPELNSCCVAYNFKKFHPQVDGYSDTDFAAFRECGAMLATNATRDKNPATAATHKISTQVTVVCKIFANLARKLANLGHNVTDHEAKTCPTTICHQVTSKKPSQGYPLSKLSVMYKTPQENM